ncbi:ATP-binding protein [Colibacter massiliensis]|uniref:ATP-binding protein n=3 Tax=Colibacter massiliensis TaxID=1852379 RepID=UPI002356E16C|nr:ATP-binding protein [Colibacter massiliensis]
MKIPKRIAQTLINSLKGGVVPRVGLPYVAVGRKAEIDALLRDVDIIADGGASFRFIVGKYGSGKSFLLQTVRNYVMARDFVVVDADLSPERRLRGTRGQGLATYRELIRNMSTKTKPEGGALSLILDRWINSLQQDVMAEQGLAMDDSALGAAVERKIGTVIAAVNELVHGFDFARLLTLYYRAYTQGDDETRANVLKWFRGEFNTKTEARQALGVAICITDDNWYEYLKLFASFLTQAGYAGMLVLVDELVNIYKVPHAVTRQYNYEKLLTMYNDAMQGRTHHLGMIFCGTPQCMEDPRRGVFSYEALRSRLAEGRFTASGEHTDLLSPVIRLRPLTYEELLVLIEKLAAIHTVLYDYEQILTQADMVDFLQIEFARIGADTHITPREIIRDFIEVLDITCQNPKLPVKKLLGSDTFSYAQNDAAGQETSEEFAEFDI